MAGGRLSALPLPSPATSMAAPALVLRQITKRFFGAYGTVVANDHIDLTVEAGEIHVIVGENGAGKSTLMNGLYGLEPPDEGEIYLFGQRVYLTHPQQAIALGLGMIHQHFMLVPSFTVAENIVLGREPRRAGLLQRAAMRQTIRALADDVGLPVQPDLPVREAPVGVQQRVEILKAIYRGARLLILDEPTAVLTPQETEALFAALRRLVARGCTIILITHKLPEVMAAADRVTVLRDGAVAGRLARGEFDPTRLAQLMTGRTLTWERFAPAPLQPRAALAVRGVRYISEQGVALVDGVSLEVGAGEIVGVAGVAQNGQEALAEVITGQRRAAAGSLHLAGVEITHLPVLAIRDLGLGHIPDDRYAEGCARPASLARNLLMGRQRQPAYSQRGVLRPTAVAALADRLMGAYGIRAAHREAPLGSLSGGNVQKAIVARELEFATHCLIAEQPSRGVDIGAAEFIYEQLHALSQRGAGILLFSTDLSELLRLSHRLLVMYRGRVVAETRPETTTLAELGLLMAGGQPARPAGPPEAHVH